MACTCNTQGLKDNYQYVDADKCAAPVLALLNPNGEDWYSREFVEDVIYNYAIGVKSGRIPEYDRNKSADKIRMIEDFITASLGQPRDRVAAVLFQMWNAYQAGTLPKNCIFVNDGTQFWIFLGAAAAVITAYFIINPKAWKATKKSFKELV